MRPGPATSTRHCCPSANGSLAHEHPDTLDTRGNLARWSGMAGDAAGARDQFAALLPIRERVLGAEHPQTLTTRYNLARWTGEAGDAAGARDQFAALLPIRERVLGAEHPHTLTTRYNLARWTGEAGDAAGARDQFAALLPIRERVLGAEHPDTLSTRARPRPLDRGGGGCGRGPRPVRRPAAHPRAGPGSRAPRHPHYPEQPHRLGRAAGSRWRPSRRGLADHCCDATAGRPSSLTCASCRISCVRTVGAC